MGLIFHIEFDITERVEVTVERRAVFLLRSPMLQVGLRLLRWDHGECAVAQHVLLGSLVPLALDGGSVDFDAASAQHLLLLIAVPAWGDLDRFEATRKNEIKNDSNKCNYLHVSHCHSLKVNGDAAAVPLLLDDLRLLAHLLMEGSIASADVILRLIAERTGNASGWRSYLLLIACLILVVPSRDGASPEMRGL